MKTALAVLAALALSCCVTVNVYFPAPAVQQAADKIVQEVRPGEVRPETPEGQKPPQGEEQRPQSSLELGSLLAWLAPAEAVAAEVDINVSTPAIRQLKASIKQRYPQLEPYYRQGALGENNDGYVEVREAGGLDLKQRAELQRLVSAENGDRKQLYQEIVKANNFGGEFVPQVAKLFANSWRKEAAPGTMIQDNNGGWRRK